MRSTFKGLFVTHKKHLFLALLLISLLIIFLFVGALAADSGDQRSWTVAGTISTALLSFAAAVGLAVSATLIFRVVGGKDKGVDGKARRKVACKVLVVGMCMVISLVGCTAVLLWSGLAENATVSQITQSRAPLAQFAPKGQKRKRFLEALKSLAPKSRCRGHQRKRKRKQLFFHLCPLYGRKLCPRLIKLRLVRDSLPRRPFLHSLALLRATVPPTLSQCPWQRKRKTLG